MFLQTKLAAAGITFLILLLSGFTGTVLAQSGPPAEAPAGWGPVSINLEEIEYPYPVS